MGIIFRKIPILILGAGELASGVAYRLYKAGFPLVMTELPQPLMVRRAVSFGEAVFTGYTQVEGIPARRVNDITPAWESIEAGEIPVVVDPNAEMLPIMKPTVLIDGRMIKRNPGTTMDDASLVIALGPGYTAGQDCHAVIETNRGHRLGRVIWEGQAEPDTGIPGDMRGRRSERVLRAPTDGYVHPFASIGDRLKEGDKVAEIAGIPVLAPFDGVLRGLIHISVPVTKGLKIGDVDPRGQQENCFTISDKALAIGGGVLEAIFSSPTIRELLMESMGNAPT